MKKINKILILLSVMMVLAMSSAMAYDVTTFTLQGDGIGGFDFDGVNGKDFAQDYNDIITGVSDTYQLNAGGTQTANRFYDLGGDATSECPVFVSGSSQITTSTTSFCVYTLYGNYRLAIIAGAGDWPTTYEYRYNFAPLNTAPVINNISPNTRIELTNGESQLYTSNVTDLDGDAVYSWTLGGIEVSTTNSYQANWDNIEAGIYTLELEVSDAEYSDSISTTLEIRAKGGSSGNEITGDVVIDDIEDDNKIQPQEQNIFEKFWSWLRGLFK